MAGRRAHVPHGRRAGHRGAGLRHRDGSAVDRIVGPGNIYVAAAKKLIAGEVGIDFVAGPTEIVIIAADGDPRWIAADMLAQAEHDVDASAILLTTSRTLAEAVAEEIERQLATLPTAAVARQSIETNGAIVVVDALEQAVEFSNRLRRNIWRCTTAACSRRSGTRAAFRGRVQPGSRGRLCLGPESRAADFGRGAAARRTFGRGFRQGDLGAGTDAARRWRNWRPRSRRWRAPKDWKRTRDRWRCALSKGLKPRAGRAEDGALFAADRRREGKLRLDFNENTVGCSPKVIEFLKRTPDGGRADDLSGICRRHARAGRLLRRRAGRVAAHQRHRRSDSGSGEHLRRRWRRSAAAEAVLRDVPLLRGSRGRERSRNGLPPPKTSRFRSKNCSPRSGPQRARF